jgi:hypothetical protein
MAKKKNQAWRSWLVIALVASMFFSMYKLNPNPVKTRELSQLEFYNAVDAGKIVEPVVRFLDRDEGETYLTGEIETDDLDKDGSPMHDKEGKPVKVQKKDRAGNPTWRVCVTLGVEQYVDSNGRLRKRQRKVQKTYHGTLADARTYCKQLSEEYESLAPATVGNTFADAVETWRKEMEINGTCAPSKLKDYTSRLGYVSPYLSSKALIEVTQNDVTAALQGAKVARNLSQGTIKDVFALTKRVFRRAVAWRWIAVNPMEDAKAPRVDEPVERRYLSIEECARFMAALDAAEEAAYSEYRAKESRALE